MDKMSLFHLNFLESELFSPQIVNIPTQINITLVGLDLKMTLQTTPTTTTESQCKLYLSCSGETLTLKGPEGGTCKNTEFPFFFEPLIFKVDNYTDGLATLTKL